MNLREKEFSFLSVCPVRCYSFREKIKQRPENTHVLFICEMGQSVFSRQDANLGTGPFPFLVLAGKKTQWAREPVSSLMT